MHARRRFIQSTTAMAASLLVLPALARAGAVAAPATAATADRAIAAASTLGALEKASGGRLGVTLYDVAGARAVLGHRPHERFPLCSTFKAVLAATVLAHSERGTLSLDQRVPLAAVGRAGHVPVTTRHIGKDLTVRDLCRATMVTSDNLAANALLDVVGGPTAVTAFLRAQGDTVTRNDRYEPEMNQFAPDDPRDTTSPAAMAATLARLVEGDALATAGRQQLADWLIDNETGDACLRAGLSAHWRVGDKTGSNGVDTRNDIAVLWPRAGGPAWVLTAYLQGATVDARQRDAVLAQVARIAQGHLR